jgi:hypothetical protein
MSSPITNALYKFRACLISTSDRKDPERMCMAAADAQFLIAKFDIDRKISHANLAQPMEALACFLVLHKQQIASLLHPVEVIIQSAPTHNSTDYPDLLKLGATTIASAVIGLTEADGRKYINLALHVIASVLGINIKCVDLRYNCRSEHWPSASLCNAALHIALATANYTINGDIAFVQASPFGPESTQRMVFGQSSSSNSFGSFSALPTAVDGGFGSQPAMKKQRI